MFKVGDLLEILEETRIAIEPHRNIINVSKGDLFVVIQTYVDYGDKHFDLFDIKLGAFANQFTERHSSTLFNKVFSS